MARPNKQGIDYFPFDVDFLLRHKNQEDCKGMRFTGYFHTNLPAV